MKVRDVIKAMEMEGWVLDRVRGDHRQRQLIAEAIEFHMEGMRLRGEAAPEPTSVAEAVEVVAA